MTNRNDLQPTSQLVLRHADTITGSRVLVVNYPADQFGAALRARLPEAALAWFSFDYAAHQHARANGVPAADTQFGPGYAPPKRRHDAALVFLPQSRTMAEYTLAMVAAAVEPQAQVLLVGATDGGIRSSRRVLEERIGPIGFSHAGRHCVLYGATLAAEAPPLVLDEWATTYQADVAGAALTVASLPGVFSHGRLDEGTQLLLAQLAPRADQAVLDFGCGVGVLGAAVVRSWPNSRVDMVDSNALALEAAQRTMALNGLAANRIAPSNVFSDLHGRYSMIVSNPPFHVGKSTNHDVVEAFLRGAKQHLLPGGMLLIVANHFLSYQPLLEQHVGPTSVLAQNNRYRVYQSVNGE